VKLSVGLVLAEWAAGMLAGLVLVRRLYRIGPGFTWLLGATATGAAVLATVARSWGAVAVVAMGLALVASARRPSGPVDLLGSVAAAACAVAAGVIAGGGALSIVRAVVGAAFLGAVTTGMIVGHWYLVDTSLPRTVIRRVDWVFIGAAVAEVFVLLAPRGMVGELSGSGRVGFAAVLPMFWVALVALTLALGLAVLGALREKGYPAVMAATGLLYLAVVTAFGVDILAKALITRAL
jgi:hypothetical protein